MKCGTWKATTRARTAAGSLIEVRVSVLDLDGTPVVLAIVRDVTERRQAEQRLRASEERFRGLLEHAADGIVLLDPDGHLRHVNQRIWRLSRLLARGDAGTAGLGLRRRPDARRISGPVREGEARPDHTGGRAPAQGRLDLSDRGADLRARVRGNLVDAVSGARRHRAPADGAAASRERAAAGGDPGLRDGRHPRVRRSAPDDLRQSCGGENLRLPGERSGGRYAGWPPLGVLCQGHRKSSGLPGRYRGAEQSLGTPRHARLAAQRGGVPDRVQRSRASSCRVGVSTP